MARIGVRVSAVAALVLLSLLWWCAQGGAISLDKDGDIKLGVRTYVNARVGTEDTHDGPPNSAGTILTGGTFPESAAGHLRQNRFFVEAELNHDLSRLVDQNVGPFSLLNDLPFKVKHLAYHTTFRGEYEGLYDWGPQEYSTATDFQKVRNAYLPLFVVKQDAQDGGNPLLPGQQFVDVDHARHQLRKIGSQRERLFQSYLEGDVGNLFWRVGRQVLSWGETDGFQLLDHINPLDSSFGGFLVSLDERRVPLDMLLSNYYIGDIGPLSEIHLEGYAAIDNHVGYAPGTPAGSAWTLPGLGAPSNTTRTFTHGPAQTIENTRGGFQLKFNALDATFGLAHYYTYFDVPTVQVQIHSYNPGSTQHGVLTAYNDGQPCPDPNDNTQVSTGPANCGTPVRAFLKAPKVQITGASTTFAVPSLYSIVRSEVAYFRNEPGFTQGSLDPLLFNKNPFAPTPNSRTTGGALTRDSFNAVVGVDANQWIRFLNPNQTILFSSQFFFKRLFAAAPGGPTFCPQTSDPNDPCFGRAGVPNPDREVLPVQAGGAFDRKLNGSPQKGLEPIFIKQPRSQYLQTLFVGTSYRSGTVSPGVTFFYDWGGSFLYQPEVTFSHDPFRLVIDYSIISAHMYKGGSGVSLLKDRDNVAFRLEYVL